MVGKRVMGRCLWIAYVLLSCVSQTMRGKSSQRDLPFSHEKHPVENASPGNVERVVLICFLVVHSQELGLCGCLSQVRPGCVLFCESKIASVVEP